MVAGGDEARAASSWGGELGTPAEACPRRLPLRDSWHLLAPGATHLGAWARHPAPRTRGHLLGAPQNGLPRLVLAVAARLWDLLLLLLCCFCFAFSEQGDLLGS